jgi:hypothetical protein
VNDQAHRFADAAMAALGRGPLTSEEVREEMNRPHCRWCRELVIRGLPCTCDRAQEEARRVRAAR